MHETVDIGGANVNGFSIGKQVMQPSGYRAFIPDPFPPYDERSPNDAILRANTKAIHLLGRLDGVSAHLPDIDWFLKMFLSKEASCSSQIEGTNATMINALERQTIEPRDDLPSDADDILHCIGALDYGMKRVESFPISLRFILELHEKLMVGARSTRLPYPGEFRSSQNRIGGTRPGNARFVPPPPREMRDALSDLEKFIHTDSAYPLIKTGLAYAQFETIHPFVDGNGRTGRMLIAMLLWKEGLLDVPVLYLSAFFREHQDLYYERLDGYHRGNAWDWIDFFLCGVIETAESAIRTCDEIANLRARDLSIIASFGKTAAGSSM